MTNNNLFWKFVLILAVVALTAFFSFPPEERINLGLDLRGGIHVLYQVQTDSAVEYEMNLAVSRIGQAFSSNDPVLTYEAVRATGKSMIEVLGTEPSRRDEVRDLLGRMMTNWNVQSAGAGVWRVEMPAQVQAFYKDAAIKTALTTIRNRVDSLGVAEPLVQTQGIAGDRILIQLPGVDDPERVKDLVNADVSLEWKEVSYPPGVSDTGSWVPPDSRELLTAQFGGQIPPDTEMFPQKFSTGDGTSSSVWWPLKTVSVVSGPDLKNAFRDQDQWGDPAVSFELTQDAGKRFEVATRANLGRKMAILLGDAEYKEVISAPVINGVIRDRGIIEGGGFTVDGAEDLAFKLKSGALPVQLEVIEERTVGPSLGRDSIKAGLTAGLVGFGGVMLFMLFYYRLSGINAVVALALNVLLVFGTLGALPFLFSGATATLTLPGIAGLILTVGMAVDSNVLIFERIREELRIGKTVRSAVAQGFGKAFLTILDCNVTTLVAAFFLFSYGTGPVKGFAVTLTIGLLCSMFTSVFVSRQLFELLLQRKQRAETLSI